MSPTFLFFNDRGRLRGGWRAILFACLFLIVFGVLGVALRLLFVALDSSPEAIDAALESNWGFVLQAAMLIGAAVLVGWGCNRILEELPLRALGWGLHAGWRGDFALGSLVGSASMALAVGIAALGGGLRFRANFGGGAATAAIGAVANTLVVSGLVFVLAAAAEEALFRGYPLQTLLRSWPAWLAIVPTSIFFAAVHLRNPNVAPTWTFLNTALAGLWLAVAYVKTRSLWFPLGVHWCWNWTMGSVFGLPVSGITALTSAPLLRAEIGEPVWLNGGGYGIEGGAACTAALVISTLFLWRTRLVRPTAEMYALTSAENPTDR